MDTKWLLISAWLFILMWVIPKTKADGGDGATDPVPSFNYVIGSPPKCEMAPFVIDNEDDIKTLTEYATKFCEVFKIKPGTGREDEIYRLCLFEIAKYLKRSLKKTNVDELVKYAKFCDETLKLSGPECAKALSYYRRHCYEASNVEPMMTNVPIQLLKYGEFKVSHIIDLGDFEKFSFLDIGKCLKYFELDFPDDPVKTETTVKKLDLFLGVHTAQESATEEYKKKCKCNCEEAFGYNKICDERFGGKDEAQKKLYKEPCYEYEHKEEKWSESNLEVIHGSKAPSYISEEHDLENVTDLLKYGDSLANKPIKYHIELILRIIHTGFTDQTPPPKDSKEPLARATIEPEDRKAIVDTIGVANGIKHFGARHLKTFLAEVATHDQFKNPKCVKYLLETYAQHLPDHTKYLTTNIASLMNMAKRKPDVKCDAEDFKKTYEEVLALLKKEEWPVEKVRNLLLLGFSNKNLEDAITCYKFYGAIETSFGTHQHSTSNPPAWFESVTVERFELLEKEMFVPSPDLWKHKWDLIGEIAGNPAKVDNVDELKKVLQTFKVLDLQEESDDDYGDVVAEDEDSSDEAE